MRTPKNLESLLVRLSRKEKGRSVPRRQLLGRRPGVTGEGGRAGGGRSDGLRETHTGSASVLAEGPFETE